MGQWQARLSSRAVGILREGGKKKKKKKEEKNEAPTVVKEKDWAALGVMTV